MVFSCYRKPTQPSLKSKNGMKIGIAKCCLIMPLATVNSNCFFNKSRLQDYQIWRWKGWQNSNLFYPYWWQKKLIVNIYNENIESKQIILLKKFDCLLENLNSLLDHEIILGGDWNFIFEKHLDASGGNSLKIIFHS